MIEVQSFIITLQGLGEPVQVTKAVADASPGLRVLPVLFKDAVKVFYR
jgi:hypothetical protein